MKQRTITGFFLYIILAPLLIFDVMEILFQLVMGGFVVVAALELISMYEKEKKFSIPIKALMTICPLALFGSLMYVVHQDTISYTIPFAVILLNVFVLFCATIFTEFDGKDIVKAVFVMLYAGLGVSSLVMIRAYNPDLILYLFLITSTTDSFAFFCGLAFGKHKMAPVISPKKTWEGAIGGSICGAIVGSCFALFFGLTSANIFASSFGDGTLYTSILIILLTLVCTVVSQMGDLVASKLKRTYQLKDFGKIFPGHGGVLDRFDSAIFLAIFLFIFTLLTM
ncbi:MAG: phosphatidate cytidylyltransferase [bacterium]